MLDSSRGINIRPYLGYSDFHSRLPVFTGNYNSLQLSMNHRIRRDLTLGMSYTWSKNLTDSWNDRGTPSTGGALSGAPGSASTYAYDPKLQMRAEAFNLFNHTNLWLVDTGLGDGNFGQATSAHAPRMMQFSGKLYF